MSTLFKYVQAQNFALAGAGAIAGANTIILKSFKAIDGVTDLTMTDFGTLGFATIEPGNGTQEEQISFTGVTQNANGTATLTGVSTVLFVNPYTATAGLAKTHPGSATFIITNTAGFYDQFTARNNDEIVPGDWTFTGQVTFSIAPISPITNPLATEAIFGIAKLSVAADNVLDPIVVGTNDDRVPVAYAVDSVGSDSYAITPSPAITAYVAGQRITFKAGTSNTGPATIAVSGLAPIAIVKNVSDALVTGDIIANQTVELRYDGTNMVMVNYAGIASTSEKGVSEKGTPAEINAGTQTGGTGAELFINPLDLPAKHLVGALSSTMPKTYFNIQLPFILWTGISSGATDTSFDNWIRSGTDVAVTPMGSFISMINTGADSIYIDAMNISGANLGMGWDVQRVIVMDFWAQLPASGTGDILMGFGGANAAAFTEVYTGSTYNRALFAMKADGVIYSVISKAGTGSSQTDISAGITNTVWNNFRIELDCTNNAMFYINGVLKATMSGANLPTANADIWLGFGRSNTALFKASAPNLSIELN